MGEERPLSNGFRNWLGRTLQLDVRRAFANAPEALAALEETLASDSSYVAAPVALETFLAQYHAALNEPAAPVAPVTLSIVPPPVSASAVRHVAPVVAESPPSPRWRHPRRPRRSFARCRRAGRRPVGRGRPGGRRCRRARRRACAGAGRGDARARRTGRNAVRRARAGADARGIDFARGPRRSAARDPRRLSARARD